MSDYASRLNSFNQATLQAGKHVANVASVVNDPQATLANKVESTLGDLGSSSSQIAQTIIGYKHFKTFMNIGQNVGNALTGARQSGGAEEPNENEINVGNVGGSTASNPGSNLGTNSEPTTSIQPGSSNVPTSNTPSGAPGAAESGGVVDEDDDGWSDALLNLFTNESQRPTSELGQATDDLVNASGLGEDGSIFPGSLDEEGATSALGDLTDIISGGGGGVPNPEGGGGGMTQALGQMGQAGEDAVNASKAADNLATGASDVANTVSKSMGTIDTIADVGESIAASSELGGVAAPAVAVVGGLISLGSEIAKVFTPQTKQAPPAPPPVQSAAPASMQIGVNLSQNQGDSGVSHGIF